jgi:hypothetical protein
MSNRRVDAIYFLLLLVVSVVGYYAADAADAADAANRSSEERAALELPDFSPPPLVLEVPFNLPYTIVKFESMAAPKLTLSDDMESVLGEVRTALLESSTLVEVHSMEDQLVAAIE